MFNWNIKTRPLSIIYSEQNVFDDGDTILGGSVLNIADGRTEGLRCVDASVIRTDDQAMESSSDGCIGTGAQTDQTSYKPIARRIDEHERSMLNKSKGDCKRTHSNDWD